MIDPIIQCAVRDLDLGLAQLSVKLRSASKDLDDATHVHCCFCHGENTLSVRSICVQQKRRTIFKYALFALRGKDLREIAVLSKVVKPVQPALQKPPQVRFVFGKLLIERLLLVANVFG